ncbi:hypothetical protein Dshi_0224 [Dinoroseobacter shibae DFL 12 = DSM 16493]|jgi:hypothetical protein|uniref:Methyltransferase n=1 Tax=Dinoroseobacter shibae (strain DSM 16493 / NCIMB 14021 / DFL 12) TaxID=398580 RepID=A8LLG3_DINSH|nr:hypothetical protein [Dinoroseobacter shibae]ABV91973.1 hypothetical protein Dshi_0224 [Dinoroseobacter shibae DFL 12 = DSM 16493]URF46945.1 hypothetical protein M8008_01135 [Dinoroseobacter shibae]URF51256.1 hypothetical protein M8007_01135 [Dinoroseobacter shibae]
MTTPATGPRLSVPAPFRDAPWQADALRAAEAEIAVPTMLAPEERQFYYWAARDWARGEGALVDLGAFAGGSTARLAAGAAAAGHGAVIHAYDRFTAKEQTKANVLYAAGVPPFEGRDILPLAQEFLAPWAAQTRFHVGHIPDLGWPGGRIELLAVDAAKIATTTDLIAAAFLPHLIPGRSLVIQQDFLHWSQPWLPAQMWRLRDHLRPVAFARRDTVAFLCTAPITPEALEGARIAEATDMELIEDIRAIRETLPEDWDLTRRLRRTIAALRANPGERIAWKMRPAPPPGS